MAMTKPQAAQIEFVPGGGLAATDMQAALAELDSEKLTAGQLSGPTGASLVGFQPAGTGAVTTNVQSKLRETVSVKDFLLCNGTDESAAFAALLAQHKSVYIPENTTVSVGSEVVLPVGATIIGASRRSSVIHVINDVDGVQISLYCTFENVRIRGKKVGTTASSKALVKLGVERNGSGFALNDSARSAFINCIIGGSRIEFGDDNNDEWMGPAILGGDTFLIHFSNCLVVGARYGYYNYLAVQPPFAISNALEFSSCEFFLCDIGAYIQNPQAVSFDTCVFENNYGPGLIVDSSRALVANACYFEGNNRTDITSPRGYTPSLLAEFIVATSNDPGASININGLFIAKIPSAGSVYGLYVGSQHNIAIDGVFVQGSFAINPIFVADTATGYIKNYFIQSGSVSIANSVTSDRKDIAFAPMAIGTTTAGVATYGYQEGRYTRDGNRVDFKIRISWTAHTGTGNITIKGLPIATTTYSTNEMTVVNVLARDLTYTGTSIAAVIAKGSTEIVIVQFSSGAPSTGIPMDTSCELWISGSYTI